MTGALLLDSNVYHSLRDDPDLLEKLRAATASGRAAVVITHVQRNELAASWDPAIRAGLQDVVERVRPTDVITAGFVLAGDDPADPTVDVLAGKPWGSMIGGAALFGDHEIARHTAYVNQQPGGRAKRQRDALLLDTAAANVYRRLIRR